MLRTPPHSIDAEQATLGAMALERDAIYRAAQIVSASDFYRTAHRLIFQAICDIAERGEAIDHTTLANELSKRGQLEQAGGRNYLNELLDVVPTAAHVADYARIVEQKSILRQLIRAAAEITEDCFGEVEDAGKVASASEGRVRAINVRSLRQTCYSAAEVMEQSWDVIAAARQRSEQYPPGDPRRYVTGVPSGLSALDGITNGLQAQDLVIICGDKSVGKTALSLRIAQHAAKPPWGITTLYASLEMSVAAIGLRQLQMEARVPSERLRSGCLTDEETQRVSAAAGLIRRLPLYIEEMDPISPLRLLARARGIPNLGMVVVDYLQRMEPDGRHDDKRGEVESIVKALKRMARELNVPVVAISSLSRDGQLRESKQIEYEADVILRLAHDEKKEAELAGRWPAAPDAPETWVVRCEVEKQRNGRTGPLFLAFVRPYSRYEDLER